MVETAQARTCIRVMSIDDHPLLREGIAAMIDGQPDMEVAALASNGKEGIKVFRVVRPDVTLMDLRLPDVSGIDVLITIRSEFPDARIIMLTTFTGGSDIHRALKAGAYGYLVKTSPSQELLDGIRHVHLGRKCIPSEVAVQLAEHLEIEPLSQREMEVLRLVATGDRNREVAQQLCLSEETVKVHVKRLMDKLGAKDRTQAVAIAVRRGMIQL